MEKDRPRPDLTPTAAEGRRLGFAVTLESRPAGWITLTPVGRHRLRVRGAVLPDCRGRGVATAALGQVCALLGRRLAGTGLVAWVDVADGAAQRVLEHNGFRCADVSRRPLRFHRRLSA
ncbi:MAG TPA: GNAT family N-acetyltransferase [Pilimelia sp.]|nr:GNAT family N-acetyltransferase [Pilimelia sp.]